MYGVFSPLCARNAGGVVRNFIIIVIMTFLLVAADSYGQIPGDFNCNGIPDELSDMVVLFSIMTFHTPPIDPTGCTWYAGDINSDGLYHTIADWMQFVGFFHGDNPPQPYDLDTIAVADAVGAPGESLELPIHFKSVDSLSGLLVQLKVDTLFFENLSISPGLDSLETYQYIAGESVFVDHIAPLGAGHYHLANLNLSIRDDAPVDTHTTIILVAGGYYPSAFANISNPTYLIRPILILGTVRIEMTDIEGDAHPDKLSLDLSNYPNPFNSSTVIRYSLDAPSHVKLTIFNILGNQIAILLDLDSPAGLHEIVWDGSDLPSGVYFYRLTTSEETLTRRMTLLK